MTRLPLFLSTLCWTEKEKKSKIICKKLPMTKGQRVGGREKQKEQDPRIRNQRDLGNKRRETELRGPRKTRKSNGTRWWKRDTAKQRVTPTPWCHKERVKSKKCKLVGWHVFSLLKVEIATSHFIWNSLTSLCHFPHILWSDPCKREFMGTVGT